MSKRGLAPQQSDFVAECRWLNKLPQAPHGSKMLVYPFESDRFVKYKEPSSLERTFRFDLHTELDLGLDLDLSDMDAWEGPNFLSSLQSGVKRHKSDKAEKDLALLAFSALPLEDKSIISDPRERMLAVPASAAPSEHAALVASTPHAVETDESQHTVYLRHILNSFDDVQSLSHDNAWKHPTQPNLHAAAVYDVLPASSLWSSSLYDVQLEGSHDEVLGQRNDLLLKGFKVRAASDLPVAEDIMAVIAPSSSTDGQTGYSWVREYNFSKFAEAEANVIIFVPDPEVADHGRLQPNPVTFKTLDGRVQLKKRTRTVTDDSQSRSIHVSTGPASALSVLFAPPH